MSSKSFKTSPLADIWFLFLFNKHCIAGGLHLAYFQYVQHPKDIIYSTKQDLPFVQKCFGAIKHFRSSISHISLDGSRIIKAIQTQNKALINTPSSGLEEVLRRKYLLVYIVFHVIEGCEFVFPSIKSTRHWFALKTAGAKKGENSPRTLHNRVCYIFDVCAICLHRKQFCSKN